MSSNISPGGPRGSTTLRLLAALIPVDSANSLVGDLDEHRSCDRMHHGPLYAGARYWTYLFLTFWQLVFERAIELHRGGITKLTGPPPNGRTTITDIGWATYAITGNPFRFYITVFNPRVELIVHVPLVTDPSISLPMGVFREYLLFDEDSQSRGTMRDVVADLTGQLRESKQLSGTKTLQFTDPTYMVHKTGGGRVRILGVTANISITPEPQPAQPFVSEKPSALRDGVI